VTPREIRRGPRPPGAAGIAPDVPRAGPALHGCHTWSAAEKVAEQGPHGARL